MRVTVYASSAEKIAAPYFEVAEDGSTLGFTEVIVLFHKSGSLVDSLGERR